MGRLAALPWYDLEETREAHARLWREVASGLRARGVKDVPKGLVASEGYVEQWRDPKLLLSQACGYDLVLEARPPLAIVATPHYDFEGCEGACYRSFIVVSEEHPAESLEALRGSRCVINNRTSHSGMNALQDLVAPLHRGGRFFSDVRLSGAHRTSLEMLQQGLADVAAVDCVVYGLLRRHRPAALAGTRVVACTKLAPAPPFVTSIATQGWVLDALREALAEAVASERTELRDGLGLHGLSRLELVDYSGLAELATTARSLGYDELGAPEVYRF